MAARRKFTQEFKLEAVRHVENLASHLRRRHCVQDSAHRHVSKAWVQDSLRLLGSRNANYVPGLFIWRGLIVRKAPQLKQSKTVITER
jgi:transposase-like protein